MANQNLNITIKAFDKTKGALASASRGIKAVGSAIFSMKTALVGVVGVAGLGLLVRQSLKATDTLAKTASKIGTTTEELSKLRFAADLTGVSTETMDMALQRFVRRTAEAAKGTGEAKGALKELNIDARELLKMPLDEQMITLSKAFDRQRNSADKVRLAMKLFDSEGVSLVNTLAAGSEGLREMFKEAEILGIVMSSSASKGVEQANDAITKLFSILKGVRDQIVGAFAPVIESLATTLKDKLASQIAAVGGNMTKFAEIIREKVLSAILTLIRGVAKIAEVFEKAADRVTFFYLGMKQLLTDGEVTNIEFKSNIGSVSGRFLDAALSLQNFKNNLAPLNEEIIGNNAAINTNRDKWFAWKESLRTAEDAIPSLEENMVSVANSLSNSLTQGFTDAITGAKSFADGMKDVARSVVDSLTKMLVQYYITQPLFDALTGFIGGQSTGGFSKVRSGTGPTQIPTGGIPGRAIGGSVQAGQPYMVGERGQELFIPNQSGSIVSNNKLGGGGVIVNQTINITTGVQQTVRAEIANLMPQISEATKAAVADSKIRGGNYSRALGA